GGRVVALGFDPAASDLPLRVDYVHLVANLVRWADPTPGVVRVAGLPGAAETAPAVSASVAPASPRPLAVGWWMGAILGLCLLCAESLRSLLGRERPT
ncbi:MAG: hypothetical protein VX000_06655, partial [Myxococcota bacterium]|nr:hypothetical protein [Myxococcota bacterium]